MRNPRSRVQGWPRSLAIARTQILLALLMLLVGQGCGGKSESQVIPSGQNLRLVDETLSVELQQKQRAVQKLLNAWVEGAGDSDALSIYAPGVDYRGQWPDFSGATGMLVSWGFNGTPQKNEVPVTLIYEELGDASGRRQETAMFVVTGTAARVRIERK